MTDDTTSCFFCGAEDAPVRVGIALDMGGEDYSFCAKCLKSMTADAFWREVFDHCGYAYPFGDEPAAG